MCKFQVWKKNNSLMSFLGYVGLRTHFFLMLISPEKTIMCASGSGHPFRICPTSLHLISRESNEAERKICFEFVPCLTRARARRPLSINSQPSWMHYYWPNSRNCWERPRGTAGISMQQRLRAALIGLISITATFWRYDNNKKNIYLYICRWWKIHRPTAPQRVNHRALKPEYGEAAI